MCCAVQREEYMVKHQPGTSNLAYTSGNLQIHTDLPYYNYKPGVSKSGEVAFKVNSTGNIILMAD
jgi:gamma-butyrobetaine dioxygenase